MAEILNTIFYIFIFLSVYVQVFLFITLLENRKKIQIRKGQIQLRNYPAVTIAVAGFNEEQTIEKTIHSLLDLNYPKDKLHIFLIDDGSIDGTWDIMRKFADHPQIKTFRKKNGGKYTALNLGLEHTQTEFFGGLDADSFVDSESLIRIMSYFERDSSAMAVVPSVIVHSPKSILQSAQEAEYHMGVYIKKMLGFLGAINVTPGPLTIFRKEVFDNLGPYRHAHNTEDMEIAYRMQKHGYKIEHCNDAYVHTNTPATVHKLYKQRLRWIYGFLNNTLDYRDVLLRSKYGNFSLFTLPMGIISVFSASYLFGRIIYNTSSFLYAKILQFQVTGVNLVPTTPNFDLFFFNPKSFMFLILIVYFLIVFSMIFGRRLAEGKWIFSASMLYFFPVFSLIAPFWLFKAMYNTFARKIPAWR